MGNLLYGAWNYFLRAKRAIFTRSAVAILDEAYADEADGLTNVIVKYAVGKKGYYYECENCVLADYESGVTENVNFYTPVDFTATSLSYSRSNTAGYNSVCLPFAFESSDVNSGTIYTTPDYDEETKSVNFTEASSIDAGVPCFVDCGTNSNDWNINKSNVQVKKDINNSSSMMGKYIKETIGTGYYKLNPDGTELNSTTSSSTCTAFRSYLYLEGVGEAKSINVVWGTSEDTDGIEPAVVDNASVEAIYSVNGTKLDRIQHGINIIKMSDGSTRKVVVK